MSLKELFVSIQRFIFHQVFVYYQSQQLKKKQVSLDTPCPLSTRIQTFLECVPFFVTFDQLCLAEVPTLCKEKSNGENQAFKSWLTRHHCVMRITDNFLGLLKHLQEG